MAQNDQFNDAVQKAENRLRKEILDNRDKKIDRWVIIIGLAIAFIASVFAIFSFGAGELLDNIGALNKARNDIGKARLDIENLKGQVKGLITKAKKESEKKLSISEKSLEDKDNLAAVTAKISNGEYVNVSTADFLDVVSRSGQLKEPRIQEFIKSVRDFLDEKYIDSVSHKDRWDVSISGNEVFVFRTRNISELKRALQGVDKVSSAILDKQELKNISILVRGMTRFYDIQGIDGLGQRAWVGYDLR